MIDVNALRALHSVATHGTLARSAEELGFTASAVSQQIKRLERQLGTPVLAPAGRGVVLTPAGQAVVDFSPDVFQSLERCIQAARSVAEGAPRGTVHVTAFSTAIRGLVAPMLPALKEACPELTLRLTEQDPDQALQSLDAGNADLALVHDADGLPLDIPDTMSRERVHGDVGDVIMPADHSLAHLGRPLTNNDFDGCAWVTSPPGTVCHQWFWRVFADSSSSPDVVHLVDDFASQMSLVDGGDVLALMPRLARPPMREGLVSVPLRRPPRRDVQAVWRTSADASPALRAVLTHLVAIAQPNGDGQPAGEGR
ncbi:LysR family transcriptional regulator [Brevibacterium yomogidense]|uniref:LysR family transcriptional regulator n=1 Tax=Brevibacterium yomogidense TaxID=946573 RepID=UPI0018DFF19E|nr:LysR family transcriptional regulator [Brevibacterium yomogidense]